MLLLLHSRLYDEETWWRSEVGFIDITSTDLPTLGQNQNTLYNEFISNKIFHNYCMCCVKM